MSASPLKEKALTENDVLVASQQYDATLVYHVSLPRKGFHSIAASALARCESLRLVDLSGNRLTQLDSLAPIAAQLTFLNLAENSITDITPLAQCAALEVCHLEGNEIASTAALHPLVGLPSLTELVLQCSITLTSSEGVDTFVLDNPVCRNAEAYRRDFVHRVQHVRWVDGVSTFKRARQLALEEQQGNTSASGKDEASNASLIKAAAASRQALLDQLAQDEQEEEASLRKLLDDAQKRTAAVRSA